jgi:hypothetical protein
MPLADGATETEKSALSFWVLASIAPALEQCHTASVATALGNHSNVPSTKNMSRHFCVIDLMN